MGVNAANGDHVVAVFHASKAHGRAAEARIAHHFAEFFVTRQQNLVADGASLGGQRQADPVGILGHGGPGGDIGSAQHGAGAGQPAIGSHSYAVAGFEQGLGGGVVLSGCCTGVHGHRAFIDRGGRAAICFGLY